MSDLTPAAIKAQAPIRLAKLLELFDAPTRAAAFFASMDRDAYVTGTLLADELRTLATENPKLGYAGMVQRLLVPCLRSLPPVTVAAMVEPYLPREVA